MRKSGIWLFFWMTFIIFGSISGFAQINDSKKLKSFEERVEENKELFKTHPEVALIELEDLIRDAQLFENKSMELELIQSKYLYYQFLKSDFEQMMESANLLLEKAKLYNDIYFEAKAYFYLSEVYLINNLTEKSKTELQKALDVLDKGDENDYRIIWQKADTYTAFANIYNTKNEYFNALNSLKNSLKEHRKLSDSEMKRKALLMDYANIGGAYTYIENLDSAEYFANQSLSITEEKEKSHNFTFINYITLGNIYLLRNNLDKALYFYKKAEAIKKGKYHLNVEELYEKIAEVYEKKGDKNLANEYKILLSELKLEVSRNQNKALVKYVEKSEEQPIESNNKPDRTKLWLMIIIFLIGVLIYLLFRIKAKKYSPEQSVSLEPHTYLNLIELLRKNDQAYLLAFEQIFPEFIPKLKKRYPDLSDSEIELLSMIRLNLSINQVAEYKDIQPKTIRNRRHVIRKKLNLSKTEDIYRWVSKI